MHNPSPTVLPAAEENVTLPRSLAFYEAQAERARGQDALENALADALHDVIVTPDRYAELMHLIDTWLVEQYVAFVDLNFVNFGRSEGNAMPDSVAYE